jgi:CRISPR/Cas system-associated endonuclease Cas3-HD
VVNATKEESHNNSSSERLSELNQQVCEFLDDYKETDSEVSKACDSKTLSQNKATQHLQNVLSKINQDFKQCSHQKSCLSQLDADQKEHFKTIGSFITKYDQVVAHSKKKVSFGSAFKQLKMNLE